MDPIDRLVLEIERLPTLPDVSTASLLELEREDCDFDEIASLISLDAVLAARVLKLANSAFFGAQKRTDTVSAAISRLGINEVRNCLITVAVLHAIPELPPPHNTKVFWTLSLASALMAQHLAAQIQYTMPDRAYTASLVHLIGEAVLAVQFTDRFRQAIHVGRTDSIPFVSALAEEFGCDHPTVTARVLREWNFPEPLIRAVRRQFSPSQAGDQVLLASLILASDGLCRDRGLGLEEPAYRARSWLQRMPESFFSALHSITRSSVGEYLDGLTEKVDEVIDFALTIY
jgi:HD-like signal output (HDOD) protein